LLTFSLYSSGLSLLLAAASRIPTWEVSSGVAWIVGTVNVGFLPIFGPIFIFGTFLYALQRRAVIADLRNTLLADERFETAFAQAALDERSNSGHWLIRRRKFLRRGFDLWLVLIPILAYTILLCSYFDFTRPDPKDGAQFQYKTRTGQVLDLMIGTGGWWGFPPLAPSIHDNLERMAQQQTEKKEAVRLDNLARKIPWIYPPLQTWAYLAGLAFMIWLAAGVWKESRI
jgi:hypothetical protein